jgi:flagellin-like protein
MNLRRFLRKRLDGEAVSPVIAVILMVAITVVLAATVYVWVSGFGAQSGTPAKSISLSSAAALDSTNNVKQYSVASATSGMKYGDVSLTINGGAAAIDGAATCPGASATPSDWDACRGSTTETSSGVVTAGDVITLTNVHSGDTLRVLDSQANSVMLTLVVG